MGHVVNVYPACKTGACNEGLAGRWLWAVLASQLLLSGAVITLSPASGLSDGNVNFGAANILRKIGVSDAPGRGCRLCCSFVNAHRIGLCCNGTCVRGG